MSVYENMLAAIGGEDIAEGSFFADNLLAVSEELSRIEDAVFDMKNRIFPTLATGDDLTLAAENFGMERKAATCAVVNVKVTGTAGAAFLGAVACTADGELLYELADGTIGADGAVTVNAVCTTAGAAGNAPAGAICETVTSYAGIDAVTNESAAAGGADEESDESLRQRVLTRLRTPSTGGNRADYLSWALSVDGVEKAYVKSPSAGQVEVYITSSGNAEASDALKAKTSAYIETVRPIGAAVTVKSGTALPIGVVVNAKLSGGMNAANVKAAIESAVRAYFASCTFNSSEVSYLRTAELLFADGVDDVVSYTLNGGTSSVALAETQFPVLAEVTVNAQ